MASNEMEFFPYQIGSPYWFFMLVGVATCAKKEPADPEKKAEETKLAGKAPEKAPEKK